MRLRSSISAPNISSLSRDPKTSPESEPKIETNPFFIKPGPGIVTPPTEKWNPPEVVYSLVHNDFRFTKRNYLFVGGKLRTTLWVEHEAFGLDVVRKVERERERRFLRERKREREERKQKVLSMISERSWVGECDSPLKDEGGEKDVSEGALGGEESGESERGEKGDDEGDETMVEAKGEAEFANSKE
ncbi:unnamed protein product [Sphagnum balticum]